MEKITPLKYYVCIEDQEHGPFEIGELEQLVKDGVVSHAYSAREVDSLQKITLGSILKNAKNYESKSKKNRIFPYILIAVFIIFIILITMIFYGFYNRIKSVESYIKKQQENQKTIFENQTENTKTTFENKIQLIEKNVENIKNEIIEKQLKSEKNVASSIDNFKKEYNAYLINLSKRTEDALNKIEIDNQKSTEEFSGEIANLNSVIEGIDKKNVIISKSIQNFSFKIEVLDKSMVELKKEKDDMIKTQAIHQEWITHFDKSLQNIKKK